MTEFLHKFIFSQLDYFMHISDHELTSADFFFFTKCKQTAIEIRHSLVAHDQVTNNNILLWCVAMKVTWTAIYRDKVQYMIHKHQSDPNESANLWPIGPTEQEGVCNSEDGMGNARGQGGSWMACGVTIEVWACLDWLLTSYDYSTKVCLVLLVMDSSIRKHVESHVQYMNHS